MSLAAGRLRSRITIQAPAHTPDGAAGKRSVWRTVASVRAEVIPMTGNTGLEDQVVRDTQMLKVTIRFREGIDTRHRLLYNGAALPITSVADPDQLRERLVIMAEMGGQS